MPALPDQTFARRLREERTRARLSQGALAVRLTARIGRTIDPSAVARAEKNIRAVRLDEAVAIADLLGVSLTAMLCESQGIDERIAGLRHDLSQAQGRVEDAEDELRSALDSMTSIRQLLAEAEATRLP